jgi:hypothetical protein
MRDEGEMTALEFLLVHAAVTSALNSLVKTCEITGASPREVAEIILTADDFKATLLQEMRPVRAKLIAALETHSRKPAGSPEANGGINPKKEGS